MRKDKELVRTIIEHRTGTVIVTQQVTILNDDDSIDSTREETTHLALENRPVVVAAQAFVEQQVAPVFPGVPVADAVAALDRKIAAKVAADAAVAAQAAPVVEG